MPPRGQGIERHTTNMVDMETELEMSNFFLNSLITIIEEILSSIKLYDSEILSVI